MSGFLSFWLLLMLWCKNFPVAFNLCPFLHHFTLLCWPCALTLVGSCQTMLKMIFLVAFFYFELYFSLTNCMFNHTFYHLLILLFFSPRCQGAWAAWARCQGRMTQFTWNTRGPSLRPPHILSSRDSENFEMLFV